MALWRGRQPILRCERWPEVCGIVGALGPDSKAWVTCSIPLIAHRGPDGSGVVDLGECALGMTRLAVLDPTPRADQPMTQGGSTVVFNGELYNFRELRSELEQLGYTFRTSGDTEVVLLSLVRWGLEALPRFEGMFAIAWWSQTSQTLSLSRDQYGIKPLYWRAGKDGSVCFASESRILAGADRQLSRTALQDFLSIGSPVRRVVHQNVRELPPGCVLQIQRASVRQHRWVPQMGRASSQPARALATAVVAHMVSDRPVALFLSGGFDSALLAAQVASAGGALPLAVTLQTSQNGVDVAGAERTAKHYGLDHVVHNVEIERLPELVLSYVAAQDQPTLDGFNTFLVSQIARHAGCVVALSGLGGDELFGGYSYYHPGPAQQVARLIPPQVGRVAARQLANALHRPTSTVAAHFGARSAVACFLASRQVFSPREVGALTRVVPVSHLGLRDDSSLSRRRQLSQLDFEIYLRSTLLRDADIFSMHHGLEVRVPLLDAAFVSSVLGAAMPPTKKDLATAVGDPFLEALAIAPKLTFSLPWSRWLVALQPVLSDLLKGPEPWRGYIDPAVALPIVRGFEAGQNWLRPWALVVLALWMHHNEVAAV